MAQVGRDLLLGLDVGSSSVKAALIDSGSGKVLGSASSPAKELPILAPRSGWAEQDPEIWWEHVRGATELLAKSDPGILTNVVAVGISYQMHGLVCLDENLSPLRPSIIWCDSRAVSLGGEAEKAIGAEECRRRFLNSPGNFTASKLAWVKRNEPETFQKIRWIMLPGDYIALKLTGTPSTTVTGLSEGILWDFSREALNTDLLKYFGIPLSLVPPLVPSFGSDLRVSARGAQDLGLRAGIPISYRAGDQPNNAFSLRVLNPGEVAATAGTSAVVYGVTDAARPDPLSRVNVFAHVNHAKTAPRFGVLLCVNGSGILNSWMRNNIAGGISYDEINRIAATVPPGSDGISVLPYGNGAERSLENSAPGASVHGLELTRHTRAHIFRAVQEGIVFALNYGLELMRGSGVQARVVRAGHANMFLSPVFREAFASTTGASVELFDTDGAQGAARGAGLGIGLFSSDADAFRGLERRAVIEPADSSRETYSVAYRRWKKFLSLTVKSGENQ